MLQTTCTFCGCSTQQTGNHCQYCGKLIQATSSLSQSPATQTYLDRNLVYQDERTRIAAREHPKIKLLLILVGVIIVGAVISSYDRRQEKQRGLQVGKDATMSFDKSTQLHFPVSLSAHYALYKAEQANDTQGMIALDHSRQTEPVNNNTRVRILSATRDAHGHEMFEVRILNGGEIIWVEDFWLK